MLCCCNQDATKIFKIQKNRNKAIFSLYITMIQVCYLNKYIFSMSKYQL